MFFIIQQSPQTPPHNTLLYTENFGDAVVIAATNVERALRRATNVGLYFGADIPWGHDELGRSAECWHSNAPRWLFNYAPKQSLADAFARIGETAECDLSYVVVYADTQSYRRDFYRVVRCGAAVHQGVPRINTIGNLFTNVYALHWLIVPPHIVDVAQRLYDAAKRDFDDARARDIEDIRHRFDQILSISHRHLAAVRAKRTV